jgi:hypothetical protein
MVWEEFIKYIIDTVVNDVITPKIDIVSGEYQSIED